MARTYPMEYHQGPPMLVWILLAVAMVGVLALNPEGQTTADTEKSALSVSVMQETPSQYSLSVYDPQKDALMGMELEDYVVCVVAAEMPAVYAPEALKAQAVAARTLAAEKLAAGGCSAREGADVCADHGHCQAFCSAEAMEEKWGEKAEQYRQKITEAVRATAGEILCYDGEPIDVFYHAQSAGTTEELAHVFSGSRPYLVSVASTEVVEPVEERISGAQVADKINAVYPQAKLEAEELQDAIAVEASYDSGRASQVRMGEAVLTGVQVRRALGLRSAQFTVRVEEDEVVFTTFGYGHGVGMSQAGAQTMAENGSDYRTILAHYYPGTNLTQLS